MTTIKQVAAVLPAAGVGRRMQSEIPKQYLQLGDATVLQWTVRALNQDPRVTKIYIATSAADPYFSTLHFDSRCTIQRVDGGATRAASVAAGVRAAATDGFQWVAVHDAARPCLGAAELSSVLDAALSDSVGALLALPVADTLKHADGQQRCDKSIAREYLWQAQTPQVFRTAELLRGWLKFGTEHHEFTDEASVLEALGQRPKLVIGRRSNFKITQPGDEEIARLLLVNKE
ncbi:2-C-methyl-D-erythritol 4-phosphate cytidylyltransferase [Pseudidiomarina piscicola]|uniref:2-C-methyl-D-erythritol 4-phosphate cytidylyltransferase n=1 Tax=Pseudidiomarina piscicola TaxID=2614830 RepID=A0A6S6WLP3_9GAMM|nr:2-C-methyl-D-erythritol 4-phosphate cytidylyltransferase [Pseudidiomarina piscicola]CAB0149859.1 2-C-methyl-D-erythritol 4-phosphate cytidylyltransferase [Pseudidiomarina piscicola]VZT39308.1 2-C-methyl-D-erythritol 4-phosphate cytidylyltransferase [Pseudomonas aeruginosa]